MQVHGDPKAAAMDCLRRLADCKLHCANAAQSALSFGLRVAPSRQSGAN